MADPSLASLYAGSPPPPRNPPPAGLLGYTQEPTHELLYNNSSELITLRIALLMISHAQRWGKYVTSPSHLI